ncbi:MAG TPA: ABC transporter ATP-binding protein, partial [Bacteroidales bacterium]|nr:ABC transporter ATP-binding protein [Bacteroidales bacterium]
SVAGLYEDSLFTGNIYEFLNLKEKILPHEPVAVITPFQREIRLENVNFRYPDNDTPALEDINMTLSKGEVVALVGPNGSGKSTLVRILCRLYDPDSGSVLYDGKDIKNFVPEEYRKQFSVLFQDFMLYNLTAGENIRLGNVAKASDAGKIKEAASEAGIHSLIESLPQGYETFIGPLFNEGRELSWGEWQKIALARTLYRDAPIMVLDEPSSALDADAEYEIFNRFREAVKGKTVLLISHRFTCIRLADRIIVLNKGKIAESGTHEELMQVKGIYYNLYLRQKSMYRDEKQT